MASALHILDSPNLSVEVYYSSEIDKKALKLQRYIFGNRITQLGSVEELSQEKLDHIGPINFLIGGSPCSDLSLVNPRRRGLHGKNSFNVSFDYKQLSM
jgi:site-specific DNA-cytosine methylase